jgi:hypothetical protein
LLIDWEEDRILRAVLSSGCCGTVSWLGEDEELN